MGLGLGLGLTCWIETAPNPRDVHTPNVVHAWWRVYMSYKDIYIHIYVYNRNIYIYICLCIYTYIYIYDICIYIYGLSRLYIHIRPPSSEVHTPNVVQAWWRV